MSYIRANPGRIFSGDTTTRSPDMTSWRPTPPHPPAARVGPTHRRARCARRATADGRRRFSPCFASPDGLRAQWSKGWRGTRRDITKLSYPRCVRGRRGVVGPRYMPERRIGTGRSSSCLKHAIRASEENCTTPSSPRMCFASSSREFLLNATFANIDASEFGVKVLISPDSCAPTRLARE